MCINLLPQDSPMVYVTDSGLSEAKEMYNLTCGILLCDEMINIIWLYKDAVVEEMGGIVLLGSSCMSGDNGNKTLTLQFTPLIYTHRGKYTCNITYNGNILNSKSSTVSVQSEFIEHIGFTKELCM